jgi:hypothetical protein
VIGFSLLKTQSKCSTSCAVVLFSTIIVEFGGGASPNRKKAVSLSPLHVQAICISNIYQICNFFKILRPGYQKRDCNGIFEILSRKTPTG